MLSVASPKHNPKLPILSISYLSHFPSLSISYLSRFPSPKSHWTAGKVGGRAHGAWDHEMFARDLGSSVFQCVAVPLVAQKSEMAVRADRLADGHKSFTPKRLDCVP